MRERIQPFVQPLCFFGHEVAAVTRMLHDGPSWINGVPIKTAFGFVLPVDVVVALSSTVSALTIIRTDFQSPHTRPNQTQKIRSAGVSFNRLGADRRKTASCCRKARFSRAVCIPG